MAAGSLVMTFVCLGLFALALHYPLPAPTAKLVVSILAAVCFLVATILTLVPGHF